MFLTDITFGLAYYTNLDNSINEVLFKLILLNIVVIIVAIFCLIVFFVLIGCVVKVKPGTLSATLARSPLYISCILFVCVNV